MYKTWFADECKRNGAYGKLKKLRWTIHNACFS